LLPSNQLQEEQKKVEGLVSVLRAISDDKSYNLFTSIALKNGDGKLLITNLHMTRKQYYSRLYRLKSAGLIKRKGCKYIVTTFGKILYESLKLQEKAVEISWKLKAIDAIKQQSINKDEMPEEELRKLIDTLIQDQRINEFIVLQK
jgi:predicted transcriptional regulator